MRVEVVSTVERPGKSVYEDALCVVGRVWDGSFWAAVFDGRRAWKEGGDNEALAVSLNAQSTGQAAAQFARETLKKAVCAGKVILPAATLAEANVFWGNLLRRFEYNLRAPEHLPGCAATALRIEKHRGILEFAHWCDTRIILFTADGEWFIPTTDNMDRLDRAVLHVACGNARVLGTNPRKALYETDYSAHSDLTNPIELDTKHRGMENTDLEAGIGVLNGMKSAVDFMQTGRLPIGRWEYLLLATDGLSLPTGLDEEYDWDEMVGFLLAHDLSLEALADEIRRRENTDMEEFWKYPRFAYHRDATGVLLQLGL